MEKILTALKFCSSGNDCPKECPYYHKHSDELGCIQVLTADAVKLVEEQKRVIDLGVIVANLLRQDIEERDKLLEAKVEEVYPEFVAEYKALKEEFYELEKELEETRRELRRERRGY